MQKAALRGFLLFIVFFFLFLYLQFVMDYFHSFKSSFASCGPPPLKGPISAVVESELRANSLLLKAL